MLGGRRAPSPVLSTSLGNARKSRIGAWCSLPVAGACLCSYGVSASRGAGCCWGHFSPALLCFVPLLITLYVRQGKGQKDLAKFLLTTVNLFVCLIHIYIYIEREGGTL